MKKQQRQTARPGNQLRIIGGQWRGRKLSFPSVPGLRPTPDRVRETLFNWLAAAVPGARCLDLFAGSGALGLEALSRGAGSLTLVDSAPEVIRQLQQNLKLLQADAETVQQPAQSWLQSATDSRYDIVFLDPPFGQDLAGPSIELLEHNALLSEDAWVYLETARDEPPPLTPRHWQLHREKQAGQVCYRLFHVRADIQGA